ncbi:alpha-N-acetylgalactosaminidase isoform X2 [Anabrus simplex]|uniref:alpha-N-acetylgalactosaminidase isoform X2 n=1 Tax=Anabrus simplex TaxID=316456 RepID=UPI0035A2679A
MISTDFAVGFILLGILRPGYGLDNGLALTPPMGWMTWERFRCETNCKDYPDECISEKLIRDTADMMVSEGYADAGYEYVIVDDCWLSHKRDSDGRLQADPDRFPNGIKALADYVHAKGLKFGIYEDIGTYTCMGYPGVDGHHEIDAQTFADWGVDYVKMDACYTSHINVSEAFPDFGRALNKTGRPIVFSCSWPTALEKPINFEPIKQHCNLWRNNGDISDDWGMVKAIIRHFAGEQDNYAPLAGPGHWNDPDMLVIGNYQLSLEQSKVQMAIWAILAAPLLMSTDLRNVYPEYKAVLQNERVIAVSQDVLGIQGRRIIEDTKNHLHVWTRPVTPVVGEEYSYAIAFWSYRNDGNPHTFKISLKDAGLTNPTGYSVEDLFGDDKFEVTDPSVELKVRITPYGVVLYKATPVSSKANFTQVK